ncbi:MAG: ABC transporter ATP-binding protein [Desulfobacterales bacterium]|nr:ABC transporter ATP-binding protein [Desulfobacterales bacterium]
MLLDVDGLEKRFGGIVALADYHVKIRAGELVGLIGPNGAGKTTVFNLLSGVVKPTRGRIVFDHRDITRLRPDRKTSLGIARTFQNIRLFNDLSVEDNIKAAFHARMGTGFWPTLLHSPAFLRSEDAMGRKSREFLELFDLTAFKDAPAKNLPHGIQRRVEVARALATTPKILLLDEPSAGLNRNETDELVRILRKIHAEHALTIFLVEHDMRLVMSLCRRIQVIHQGRVLAMGAPDEVRRNQEVIEAYLGKSDPGGRHAQD